MIKEDNWSPVWPDSLQGPVKAIEQAGLDAHDKAELMLRMMNRKQRREWLARYRKAKSVNAKVNRTTRGRKRR